MLKILLLVSLVVLAATAPITINNAWTGGFEGLISIPVPRTFENGWTFILTFSKPVTGLQIWNADIVSTEDGGKRYVMKNKYAGRLEAGSKLEMNFICNVNGPTPTGEAYFEDDRQTPRPTTPRVTERVTGGTERVTQATNPTARPSGTPSKYNLPEVIRKSILFYEANRSGRLPGNNRIPWRGDSGVNDGSDVGHDLTGGWHDAGDHVKFGFPMAYSVTALSWGLLEFEAGYKASGEYNNMLDSIKWPLDYFIRCHTRPGYEFYGQVGNGDTDHAWWGRPEDMGNQWRPAYKVTRERPGSDLTGETAAAMAAGSLVFRTSNTAYANELLRHAEILFDFADKYRGKYVDSITDAVKYYNSHSGYLDELFWASTWLYRATNNVKYLNYAKANYNAATAHEFSWDNKVVGAQLMLYTMTKDQQYAGPVQSYVDAWLRGGGKKYTPKGLCYHSKWGANRYTANTALIAMIAAKAGLKPVQYRDFASSQINYMLGDGGRSFVCGFGNNPPQRPHHKASSCPWRPAGCDWGNYNNPGPNPQVLNGALVGGPGEFDDYEDRRDDYVKNEVATDYNAAFQGAVAGLHELTL